MKKLTLALVVLLALAFAGVADAAELYAPNKPHTGQIGKDGRPWKDVYSDYWYMTGGTAYEIKHTGTPTADRTITWPDASGTPMLSAAIDAAGAIWTGSNYVRFEGATADTYETSIYPREPTADRTIYLPDYSGDLIVSTLAGNAPDVADSIWGISGGLSWEGTTANTYETTLYVRDPTADNNFYLPNASSGDIMVSALSGNAPNAANSIWGASNALVFEGATANAYETSLTVADPTAARTITLPNATGTVNVNCTTSHDYAAGSTAWTMTAAEASCNFFWMTNATGTVDAYLPAAVPGKTYTLLNGTGQNLNFLVTGKTGGSIATGKYAFYTTGTDDVYEVWEKS